MEDKNSFWFVLEAENRNLLKFLRGRFGTLPLVNEAEVGGTFPPYKLPLSQFFFLLCRMYYETIRFETSRIFNRQRPTIELLKRFSSANVMFGAY